VRCKNGIGKTMKMRALLNLGGSEEGFKKEALFESVQENIF
jgi:hypothetical protein